MKVIEFNCENDKLTHLMILFHYSKEIAISEECKRALFEALCLHNGSNLDEKRPLDEDFYNRPVVTQQYEINLRGPTSTWK